MKLQASLWRRAIFPVVLAGLLAAMVAQPAAATVRATRTTVQGTLQFAHGDDFAGHHSSVYGYSLRTAQGRLQLAFDGAAPDESMAGATIRVRGLRSGNTVHVGGASGGGVSVVSAATVAAGPQTKNVLVVQFNFSNDRSTPWTVDFAKGVVFNNVNSIAAYYGEQSYSQVTMTGDVTPWLQISNDNSGCAYGTWASAANSAATAAGISLSGYTNFVYAFP